MADSIGYRDEEALVAAVDHVVESRDFRVHPPKADETLAAIGVGAHALDYAIRNWINDHLRTPHGLRKLVTGELTVSMTWAAFVKKALS